MKEAAKVYLARAGKNGEDEDYALENNVAIIGFEGIPSLESAKNYDTVATRVSDARSSNTGSTAAYFATRVASSSMSRFIPPV